MLAYELQRVFEPGALGERLDRLDGKSRVLAIGTTVSMQRTNGLDSTRSKVASLSNSMSSRAWRWPRPDSGRSRSSSVQVSRSPALAWRIR